MQLSKLHYTSPLVSGLTPDSRRFDLGCVASFSLKQCPCALHAAPPFRSPISQRENLAITVSTWATGCWARSEIWPLFSSLNVSWARGKNGCQVLENLAPQVQIRTLRKFLSSSPSMYCLRLNPLHVHYIVMKNALLEHFHTCKTIEKWFHHFECRMQNLCDLLV